MNRKKGSRTFDSSSNSEDEGFTKPNIDSELAAMNFKDIGDSEMLGKEDFMLKMGKKFGIKGL